MRFPNEAIVNKLKETYTAGTRVKLTKMDDVQAPPIGTLGTVIGVDDTGSILVDWDNGFWTERCLWRGPLPNRKGG